MSIRLGFRDQASGGKSSGGSATLAPMHVIERLRTNLGIEARTLYLATKRAIEDGMARFIEWYRGLYTPP